METLSGLQCKWQPLIVLAMSVLQQVLPFVSSLIVQLI
jgi:hypothetical protein